MQAPDLNLLYTLDVLLSEGSVTRAARKLRLSPSAMSRSLARLRSVTGDQLLVQAGRTLVPTPRAVEMREKVRDLVQDARVLLRPAEGLNLSALERSFTLRTSDGFMETFGPSLIRKIRDEAPGIHLRFIRKLDKDSAGLRDGSIDFETGVVAPVIGPEVRAQALFIDRYVGVVRAGHPLAERLVTVCDYIDYGHVIAWRQGLELGLVDELLHQKGMKREVVASVDGFAAAASLARGTDLIATIPEKHTSGLRHGMSSFALPLPVAPFTISLLWHPRLDGDPAHRWLRECIREVCNGSESDISL
ncbi:LysR family transcriptional regulator [Sphingomonas sp. MAH-20]|uniref:LysR family transcriptional regulator n=2 Tax=Sphingomonadaceae TaxID=41297 RepID=A0A6I4J598_9SPHN|nr:LysR family transcriptional regulator [Sphingomonas sp. CGMCC 1.13658]MVO79516.1 LysR family transcriptional regulator [Sphingomonas horti]